MSDKHPILYKVIAGLIVAGIASMFSWLVGWLPGICRAIKELSIESGRALVSSISIPLWMLIILDAVFLLNIVAFFVFIYRRRRRSTLPSPVPAPLPMLSNLEEAIMKMLAGLDGTMGLMPDDILKKTGDPRLRISQALDRLIELDYIIHRGGRFSFSGYYLTGSGRDYVIDKGYV